MAIRIPEYRLPKQVLRAETDRIAGLGVELRRVLHPRGGPGRPVNGVIERTAVVRISNPGWSGPFVDGAFGPT